MRKERLIVPVLAVLALAWAVAQTLAGLLFERELARTLEDLQARGELSIRRSDVQRGWLTSRGILHVSSPFGQGRHLDIVYRARHGVLSTRLAGTLRPHLPARGETSPGDVELASPDWEARYNPFTATFDGRLELSPLVVHQQGRTLTLQGGRVLVQGSFGDWRLKARLASLRLDDGEASLRAGPVILESRYAYTEGAYHFTQQDLLRLQGLAWRSPDLSLDADEIALHGRTTLDEEELRLRGRLDLGEIRSSGEVLATGDLTAELSRLDADALRALLAALRREAARGPSPAPWRETLSPVLRQLLADSPRLDIHSIDLDSPMLGLSLQGEGVLVFDARDLAALDPSALDESAERGEWRERLDGDFLWRDLPPVIALWLGLPLDTRELQIDVVRGEVRLNGRPLPPVLESLR
ncbi:DUF945 family protein [Halomonas organivorans]